MARLADFRLRVRVGRYRRAWRGTPGGKPYGLVALGGGQQFRRNLVWRPWIVLARVSLWPPRLREIVVQTSIWKEDGFGQEPGVVSRPRSRRHLFEQSRARDTPSYLFGGRPVES